MNFSEIIFDVKDSVALLTLNRPDIRNAITGEKMVEEIESACRIAQESSEINVMIVTGAGPAFSSGGNIKAGLCFRFLKSSGASSLPAEMTG